MTTTDSTTRAPLWPSFAASTGRTPADQDWRRFLSPDHAVCVNTARTPMRFQVQEAKGVREFVMPPGGQWIVPAGVEVVLRDLTSCRHAVVTIDPAHFARIAGGAAIRLRHVVESRPLEYLVRALAHERARGGPAGYAFAESLVLGITLQLSSHADGSGSDRRVDARPATGALPRPVARRVLELIDAEVEAGAGASKLSIEMLAQEAGLSPSRFFRAFKATVGAPPYRYVLRRRLERARRLLDHPDAALSTVAFSTGFADQSHLTRHFRRHFGITPGSLLRRRRNSETIAR